VNDLLERKQAPYRQKLGAGFGHAVEAADIAAVSDADTKVGVNAPERID
jgi:hypothetical protein